MSKSDIPKSNLPCGHWNKNYDYPGFTNAVCRDCGQRVASPPITGQKVFDVQ